MKFPRWAKISASAVLFAVMVFMEVTGWLMVHGHPMTADDGLALTFAGPVSIIFAGFLLLSSTEASA